MLKCLCRQHVTVMVCHGIGPCAVRMNSVTQRDPAWPSVTQRDVLRCSLVCCLLCTHTHTHTHTLRLALTVFDKKEPLTHWLPVWHTQNKQKLDLSLTHTHTYACAHTLTYTHTRTHTLTQTHCVATAGQEQAFLNSRVTAGRWIVVNWRKCRVTFVPNLEFRFFISTFL